MAELPRYERAVLTAPETQELQMVNLQEQVRSSQSISGALDQLSKFAFQGAARYAQEEAYKYAVDNPLTLDQLEEASRTGANPIESALSGGMIWNDAVKKLYAQQASSELTNSAYKHYENVYQRVRSGELTDAGQIKQELETPLKSWSSVIAEIDPESASQFYARRISDGNSYYKASLKEIGKQEQQLQDAIAEDTMYGLIRQFEVDVQNQEPDVIYEKYVNGQDEATQLFDNSPRKQQYKNEIENQFTTALFRKMSQDLQTEYGSSIEVLSAMQEDKLGKYSDLWKKLTPLQKEKLESVVKSDFSRIDTQNKAQLKSITDNGKQLRDALISGEDSANLITQFTQYAAQADTVSGPLRDNAIADIQETTEVIRISEKFKHLSLPQIEAEIEMMRENPATSREELNIAEKHYNALETQRNQDLSAFALKRHKGVPGDVTLFYSNDPEALRQSFNDQFSIVSSHPDYKSGTTNLLTKAQTQELASFLESDEGKLAKAQVATNIAAAFGEEAISIFNEIAPKDPVFSRMGSLIIENPQNARSVLDKVMTGQTLIDNKQVGPKLQSARNSDIGRQVTRALELADPKNIDGVFASADAYYVALGGDTENIIDSDLYQQALIAVTGGMVDNYGVQYGGFANINDDIVFIDSSIRADLVDDYISTAQLNDFSSARITDLDEEQLLQYSDNLDMVDPQGVPYSIDDLNRATLKQTTDGYILTDETGNPFMDQNGRMYLFNLNTLQDFYNNKKMYGRINQPTADWKIQY